MPELKACFEQNGFADVATYIQSGNVLFASPASRNAPMTDRIEEMLAESFDYIPTVVVRSRKQMRSIVDGAPVGFGSRPAEYRYDVFFLKEPLTARRAIGQVPTNPAVDTAHAGIGVLYFSRPIAKATREPAQRDHFVAHLPERDDPQLEHDDEAPVVDGRALLTALATSAWLALRSPRPGASEPPSSRARSAADGRTRS